MGGCPGKRFYPSVILLSARCANTEPRRAQPPAPGLSSPRARPEGGPAVAGHACPAQVSFPRSPGWLCARATWPARALWAAVGGSPRSWVSRPHCAPRVRFSSRGSAASSELALSRPLRRSETRIANVFCSPCTCLSCRHVQTLRVSIATGYTVAMRNGLILGAHTPGHQFCPSPALVARLFAPPSGGPPREPACVTVAPSSMTSRPSRPIPGPRAGHGPYALPPARRKGRASRLRSGSGRLLAARGGCTPRGQLGFGSRR